MANFFNGFPQQQIFPQQQFAQPQNNVTVQMIEGEAGARMYPVAAGNTVLLMDFYAGKFWLKSTSPNGFPSQFTAYNFTEEKPPQQAQANGYVSQEEFHKFQTDLIATLQGIMTGENNNAKFNEQSAGVSSEVQRICDKISEQREKSSTNGTATA